MELDVKAFNGEMLQPLLILETENFCANAKEPCKHCSVEAFSNVSEESIDFNKAIDEFIALSKGKGHVVFKNGAGALGGKELSLIRKCIENGLDVSITTEGVFVSEKFEEGIGVLSRQFPGKISYTVSLDGATKEVYGLIRQEKYFEKACKFIKKQVDKGMFVSTNFVVHKGNVNHIPEYADFAVHELGVKRINFLQLGLVGNALKNRLEIAEPKDFFEQTINVFEKGDAEIKDALESTFVKAIQDLQANPNKHFACEGCVAGSKNFAFIKSSGGIYPCSSLEAPGFLAGNIKTISLEEAMKGDAFKKARKLALQLRGNYPVVNICPGRNVSIEKDRELAEYIRWYLDKQFITKKQSASTGHSNDLLQQGILTVCFNRAW